MVPPRSVFAHYVVGLTLNSTSSTWVNDITSAAAASIDGFALNIGASDTFTLFSLQEAYDAALKIGNFSLFLSFDFGAGGWTVDKVANLTNQFKDQPAQFKVDGKPLVSTFEGAQFENDWTQVRPKVDGDIYLVPDWSSLTLAGMGKVVDEIDGAFSWLAWPNASETHITTDQDTQYQAVLGNKSYMMGVSPYFYSKVSSLGKNWYSSSDSLWFDRWNQVLSVMPSLVEIISWNDFGESHYIADTTETQVIAAAQPYVDGFPHGAFRTVLPYYIAAYKAGSADVALPAAMGDGVALAWYRTTPANISGCGDGGAKWGQEGTLSATAGTVDAVNVIAVAAAATQLTLSVGSGSKTLDVVAGKPQYFQVLLSDLGNSRGNVTIVMGGETAEGPAITDDCLASNVTNFNSVAMSVTVPSSNSPASGGSGSGGGSSGSGGSQNAGSFLQPSTSLGGIAALVLGALLFV